MSLQDASIHDMIDKLISALGIDSSLKDEIVKVYLEINSLMKYCRRDSKIAAAVFIALYQKSLPLSINAVVKTFKYKSAVDNKALRKQVWTIISNYFRAKNIVSMKKMINVNAVKDFIYKETGRDEAVKLFLELYEAVSREQRFTSTRPSILMASCALVSMNQFGVVDAFKKILHRFRVSRPSLKKYSSEIEEIAKDIINKYSCSNSSLAERDEESKKTH